MRAAPKHEFVPKSVRIGVCGHLRVKVDGVRCETRLRRQGRLLLAFLALSQPRAVSRDELTLAVWGEEAGEHAAGMSSLLSRLRQVLGHTTVATPSRGSVQLASGVEVDYHVARAQMHEAQRALQRSDVETARTFAQRVAEAADRGLLAGETTSWLEAWRRELAELGLRARRCLAEAALLRGGPDVDDAVERAREIARAEPYQEAAHALLMRALSAQGNVAEALRVYDRLRTTLQQELGVAPGPRVRALHDELLAGRTPDPHRAEPPALPLPAMPDVTGRTRARFVGRADEMSALRRAFDMAAAGGSRLVFLEGEAGIGKTRLATELMHEWEDRGAVVLYGRCDAEAVMPYQPFIEAIRRRLSQGPLVRDAIGGQARFAGLARVLPELADEARTMPRAFDADEDSERYRLFESVSALLAEVSGPRPALLMLDDLHWADRPTLLMLRHVLRFVARLPMLIVGTYRESERGAALLETLVDLRREHDFERVSLGGLREPDAAVLISELSGRPVPSRFTHELWDASRGNPFFLEEVLRHRLASGEAATPHAGRTSVPESVKELIGRRLSRLSSDVRTALEIACVAGSEFPLAAVEAAGGLSEDALDRALQEAVDARLIVEVDDEYGRFAFEHDLTRQTLYEGLTRTRRSRLHLRVAEALERHGSSRDAGRFAELARHFLLAPPDSSLARAVDYSLRAAQHASDVLAYEEAVRHYGIALSGLDRLHESDARRQGVLLALGDAQVKAGETSAARVSFREAGDIARARGSPEGLAKAALGYGKIAGGVVDEATVGLLTEALDVLGDRDDVLRARLLARLVIELSFASDRARLAAYSDEAVRTARRTKDPAALSPALIARHWALWDPENFAERLETATELLRLGAAGGHRKIELQGHRWRMMNLLERGELDEADAEIEAYGRLARARRLPSELWYEHLFRGLRLVMSGRYAEAQEHIEAGLRLGRRVDDSNADQGFTIQLVALRYDRGGLRESEDAVRANVLRYPAIPGWRALLAVILAETGQPDEAGEVLHAAGSNAFAGIPRDGLWLGAMSLFAEAVHTLDDTAHAAMLYRLLAPYPDRNVVIGWASACTGSSSRPLALLAATLGRRDVAAHHFEVALAMNERLRASPWIARTRVELGQLLTKGIEVQRGVDLIRRGHADARRLGMAPLMQRAAAALAGTTARPRAPR